MKNLTIIYSGEDGESAQALADKIRAEHTDNKVQLHSTEYFFGAEVEAERVIIMPDVPFFRAMPIKEAYPKAEYAPPDQFTTKQVKAALTFVHDLPIGGASGVPCMSVALGENININPPTKRPRGRPRKVAA